MKRAAVGLFAKPVVPGRVKTRLCPPLSSGDAARLYRAFLADTTATLAAGTAWDWTVFSTDPAGQEETWPAEAPRPRTWHPQVGEDLGRRMHQALCLLLDEGYERAVLVGSDHPTLRGARIAAAIDRLDEAEVVLGPSLDGGYYLVGVTRPRPELFTAMEWSTPRVFADTLERLRALDARVAFTDPWYDVDTHDDLRFLRLHLEALALESPDAAPCPHTRAVLADPDA